MNTETKNRQFDLLADCPPAMPKKLPGMIKTAISPLPSHIRMAGSNAIFPPMEAHMTGVSFVYWDNTTSEPNGMEGVVGCSAVGKGYVDPMIECAIRPLREHDKESYRRLYEYDRVCNTSGSNKTKPDRPKDCAIFVPEADMTNAALVQLLLDAEREGGHAMYTLMPEVDLMNQCCGSHEKVTRVIRLNFDAKRYGAQRVSSQGVKGNPILRWRFNFACVEEKARQFFKGSLVDGTLGRIGFSYIPKPKTRLTPRQGKYDERYCERMDEYIARLTMAKGQFSIRPLNALMLRLKEELEEVVDLSGDESGTFEGLVHRSLRIAWMKGCVLYLAEGQRFTAETASFVQWCLYYDLWSKIHIFAPQMKVLRSREVVDVRKYGPSNMLQALPVSFSREQLEQQRVKQDMSADGTGQLHNWCQRGFITYDASTQLYTKTAEYLAKHPVQSDGKD